MILRVDDYVGTVERNELALLESESRIFFFGLTMILIDRFAGGQISGNIFHRVTAMTRQGIANTVDETHVKSLIDTRRHWCGKPGNAKYRNWRKGANNDVSAEIITLSRTNEGKERQQRQR